LIFVDSSAWISYFNGTKDPVAARLGEALESDQRICLIDLVVTEVLQGFRQDREFELARRTLAGVHRLPLSHSTYVDAARLYRRLRLRGLTPKTIDCVIAQACLDSGASLLTKDIDFQGIAQHTRLKLAR
jgi:predicted nucleic acid-binding protein